MEGGDGENEKYMMIFIFLLECNILLSVEENKIKIAIKYCRRSLTRYKSSVTDGRVGDFIADARMVDQLGQLAASQGPKSGGGTAQ